MLVNQNEMSPRVRAWNSYYYIEAEFSLRQIFTLNLMFYTDDILNKLCSSQKGKAFYYLCQGMRLRDSQHLSVCLLAK